MSNSSNTIITPPTAPLNATEAAQMMPTAKGGEVKQPDADYFNALSTEVNDKGFLVTSTEDVFNWPRTAFCAW
jgi:NADH-quinone oxidoreductase subunit B